MLSILSRFDKLAKLCISDPWTQSGNPCAPGAGTPPPGLAGRDDLREMMRIALARIREGKSAKSVLMVGLRGVGKTVLPDRLCSDADEAGMHTMWAKAPENRSLPSILAPQLRSTLLRLSRIEKAKDTAIRALRGLAGFAQALKVKFNDIEIGFDVEPGAWPGRQRRSRGRSCGSAISGWGGCT